MKNFENNLHNAEVSAKDNLITHTYFLCEAQRGSLSGCNYYTVIYASNDYRDITQRLFTRNGCRLEYAVLVHFDGILYPFHQGEKIDLSNPAIWVKRDIKNYLLKDYAYIVEPETNN